MHTPGVDPLPITLSAMALLIAVVEIERPS